MKEKPIFSPSFIGKYDNALADETCDAIIKYADNVIKNDPVGTTNNPHIHGPANYRKEWYTFTTYTE